MNDMLHPQAGLPAEGYTPTGFVPGTSRAGRISLGEVFQIGGAGSQILVDMAVLQSFASDSDDSIANAGQVGSQIKMRVANSWLIASIRSLVVDRRNPAMAIADIDFLGEGEEEKLTGRIFNFRRGVTRYPAPGTSVFPLTSGDMQQVYAADERAHIEIGTVYPTRDTRCSLYIDSLLGKHFALLGSTGTGKSTLTALMLHRICQLAPQGHIVMIDPHGEYGAAFQNSGAIFDVNNLALPYWLMNFDEHCEVFITSEGADRTTDRDILAKCLLAARARNRLAENMPRLTVDSPVPYLLSDLTTILANEMGKLDKGTGALPYMRLKAKIDEIRADPRYSFMFSGMLVSDTMTAFLAKLFRMPGGGKPISIVDTSGMPSDITAVVVSVLSRLVFDYALWSRQEPQRPILLVCEEAHRYIPSDSSNGSRTARKVLERIAKEGRKYGVSLGLVTQRPSDLAEGVLSQCGTMIAMRLNNDRDQAYVKAALPEGAEGFLDAIPALRNRECIICGEGVAIPTRVTLDTLEPAKRPASHDPVFSELWRNVGGEDAILERTVGRWRNQGR